MSHVCIYLLNVNNKRLERVTWRYKDVFIVNFEYISHRALVFLLLTERVIAGWENLK